MKGCGLILLLCAQAGSLLAQEPAVAGDGNTRTVASLQSVVEPLGAAINELEKLRKESEQAASAEAKQDIQGRIDAERERVRKLRDNFRDILGGAQAAEYEGSSPSNVNLQEQIGELIQPILGELREATSAPRELDALRKSLDLWTERKSKADIVVARIDELSKTIKDEALTSELESARRLWTGRQAEAAGQIGVINSQIRPSSPAASSAAGA
jgi:uncharacterized protein YPO0396